MNSLSPEEIFTTAEAAEYIKRSPGAVRNLVMRRAIPFRKPGGRLMFLRSELVEWIMDAPGVRLEDLRHGR